LNITKERRSMVMEDGQVIVVFKSEIEVGVDG